MLNAQDQEKITKCRQAANLLVQDLKELGSADNHALAEIALQLKSQAEGLERCLSEMEKAAR